MEAGCGIAPIEYKQQKPGPRPAMGDRPGVVSAGRRSVAGGDEHRSSQRRLVPGLSADHSPADGPHLPRSDVLKTRPPARARALARWPTWTASTRSNEICIITRSGPARMLGLKHKGHLGPGADADVTIYTPDDNKQTMFELPRFVIKAGRVIVEQGEIREPTVGKTLHVAPDYDRGRRGRHRRVVRDVLLDPLPQLPGQHGLYARSGKSGLRRQVEAGGGSKTSLGRIRIFSRFRYAGCRSGKPFCRLRPGRDGGFPRQSRRVLDLVGHDAVRGVSATKEATTMTNVSNAQRLAEAISFAARAPPGPPAKRRRYALRRPSDAAY